MFPVLSTFLLSTGVWIALLCALVGLGFAYHLVRSVFACSPGNARMVQIAGAVEEGAKAYLHRQLISVGVIAAILFVVLIFFRGFYTSLGFLVGQRIDGWDFTVLGELLDIGLGKGADNGAVN